MNSKLNCVMLIDDDKLTNFINKIVIENLDLVNYVIKKESTISGLKYLMKSAEKNANLPFPDFILLDIDMPTLTGWDFMDRYREIKKDLPYEPIIYLLSGVPNSQDYIKLSSTGELSGLCEKPLTDENLRTMVDKYFIAN